jgi:hypothetical protein
MAHGRGEVRLQKRVYYECDTVPRPYLPLRERKLPPLGDGAGGKIQIELSFRPPIGGYGKAIRSPTIGPVVVL